MSTRIYLVEDHAVLRRALADALAYEPDLDVCGTAESAEAALATLPSTPCDVLVADVGLPGMDGVALAVRVGAGYPDLPVLLISADDRPDVVARARAAGARGFLSKRQLARTLPDALRTVCRGGTRFDVEAEGGVSTAPGA